MQWRIYYNGLSYTDNSRFDKRRIELHWQWWGLWRITYQQEYLYLGRRHFIVVETCWEIMLKKSIIILHKWFFKGFLFTLNKNLVETCWEIMLKNLIIILHKYFFKDFLFTLNKKLYFSDTHSRCLVFYYVNKMEYAFYFKKYS